MYNFEDIELRCIDGKYLITAAGVPVDEPAYTEAELRNALIAVRRFTAAVQERLNKRARSYLADQGHNPVMGCKIDLSCMECIAYHLNAEDAGCIWEHDDHGRAD